MSRGVSLLFVSSCAATRSAILPSSSFILAIA
jgi:hypothetical protein